MNGKRPVAAIELTEVPGVPNRLDVVMPLLKTITESAVEVIERVAVVRRVLKVMLVIEPGLVVLELDGVGALRRRR